MGRKSSNGKKSGKGKEKLGERRPRKGRTIDLHAGKKNRKCVYGILYTTEVIVKHQVGETVFLVGFLTLVCRMDWWVG